MTTINVRERVIGRGHPPFVIAETGINHNGELEKAYAMIRAAKQAGADAVKFQTFKAEEFISDPGLTYTYKSQGKEVTESMLEMFKRYEFATADWVSIKKKCEEEEIAFLSTPQNPSDLDLLLKIGIEAIKVGSDDFTNLPLLKQYARSRLPIFVSCGMSDLADVHQAMEVIGALDGYPTVLLLCTSQYPTPLEDVNLLKLKTLSNAFPDLVLGFSDHTQGCLASCLAVALGAVVFEKHFTLDRNLPGPDHWFSEDIPGLREWTRSIRMAHTLLGSATVRPTSSEEEMKIHARRSIVALRDIREGDLLTEENVGLRRPGHGLPPAFLSHVLGLRASRAMAKGRVLRLGDFQ